MTDEFVERFVKGFRTTEDRIKEIQIKGDVETFACRYKDLILTLTITKKNIFFYQFNNDFSPTGDIYVEKIKNNFLITVQRYKHFDYFINDNVATEEDEVNFKRWVRLGEILDDIKKIIKI